MKQKTQQLKRKKVYDILPHNYTNKNDLSLTMEEKTRLSNKVYNLHTL